MPAHTGQWMPPIAERASPNIADFVSPDDSEIVRRTRRAGFINLGKTNVPENGWCLSTEPPMRGPTLNPRDTSATSPRTCDAGCMNPGA